MVLAIPESEGRYTRSDKKILEFIEESHGGISLYEHRTAGGAAGDVPRPPSPDSPGISDMVISKN